MPLQIHIINHTHWDREWFLSHIYTNKLIPRLIDRLDHLVAENPDFQYFLDGQTLIVEDLLNFAPQYKKKIDTLVHQGNLIIGPYYCQPDWKMTCGEALIRNLQYGYRDARRHGSTISVGWMVDTFGHISQTPQIHRLFDIEAVYVWRGVPVLQPYFNWQSPDGSQISTINLFGGYRNLYGVTHVPELAVLRLETEARRLQPYYPTPDIPLFDGYDLEDNPEDPLKYFQEETEIPADLNLRESTPGKFAQVAVNLPSLPTIQGELNSGKFGATFPGTLSSRTYLKIMAHDCEHLLYQVCEPLAALTSLSGRSYPADQFEGWARGLLQNAIHDCLCGVSIDMVHEKMEYTYRQIFDELQFELSSSLSYLLGEFAPGNYAISTNPFPYEGWQVAKDRLYPVNTGGVGVSPSGKGIPIDMPNEHISTFIWQNDHYKATILRDGTVRMGEAKLGALIISKEVGDTYSEEAGDVLENCQPHEVVIEQRSAHHCVLRISYSASTDVVEVNAVLRIWLDSSPLIRWIVDLDSSGTDFRVEMAFDTRLIGDIFAGMPFDIVRRAATDSDLLPRQLHPDLNELLLGQREVGDVRSFPFHNFIAISNGGSTSAVFARGLHSYKADEEGRITILLRRAMEWLTRSDLSSRVGDAGPIFYVPDARCERPVRYELAFTAGNFGVADADFLGLNAGFQNPPLLVQSQGTGVKTDWRFFQENLPLDNLHCEGKKLLARLHNPGWQAYRLNQSYLATDVWGNEKYPIEVIPAKKIVTLALETVSPTDNEYEGSAIEIYNPPAWRVGKNHVLPSPAVIDLLKEKVIQLEIELAQVEDLIREANGRSRYQLEHQYYVLRREMYEYLLSARLNELKRKMGGELTPEYLFKPQDEIMSIGIELNRMRIKRRIFDYVRQIL